jgi:hypothetical protein
MIFTQRFERTVDQDNTVRFHNLVMQLERAEWRPTMAGCKVVIHQHLDATLTLIIAGHRVGHYSAQGKLLAPLTKKQIKAVEKTHRLYDDRLINQTGHFTCLENRTFPLAKDTEGLATNHAELVGSQIFSLRCLNLQ